MPTDADIADAPLLRSLSGLLWRERVALDRLADHLLMGDPDVAAESLYQSISALELERAITVHEVGRAFGTDDPNLRTLVDLVPPAWSAVLASHRRALVDLTNEVTRLARRPFVDVSDGGGVAAFGVSGVRRYGVQRSLRDFIR